MMSTHCREQIFVSFAKRQGIIRKTTGSMMNGKRKTPVRKSSYTIQKPISCYNCGKDGHILWECRGKRRNNGRRENGTLESSEFWNMLGGKMLEKSNARVSTEHSRERMERTQSSRQRRKDKVLSRWIRSCF